MVAIARRPSNSVAASPREIFLDSRPPHRAASFTNPMNLRSRLRYAANIAIAGASLLAAASVYRQWLGASGPEGIFAMQLLAGLLLLSVAVLVWQEYRFSRKARYAEATESLLQFVKIPPKECGSAEKCVDVLKEAAREISEAFTLVTGTRVSTCIKRVAYEPAQPVTRVKVVDICRDPKSQARATRILTLDHWVDANTAFKRTWATSGPRAEGYFFSNRLADERQYQNTSFEAYGEPRTSLWHRVWPEKGWTLPYLSTIVVPVVGQRDVVVGYVGIDSKSTGVFSKRYDVTLLQTFAHCLAPVVETYVNLMLENTDAAAESGHKVAQ